MRKNALFTIILCILPLWWIFQILWLPGFMHVLGNLAYRFEPIQISVETATSARNRAYEYATRGGKSSDDIYFTAAEISHLDDVSRLYKPTEIVLNTLAVFAWAILFLAVYRNVNFRFALQLSGKILAGLLIAWSTGLLFFSIFFEKFHELLFPGGNWSFPADSLLITIFPETFWKLELGAILLFVFLFVLLYRVLSSWLVQDPFEKIRDKPE